MSDGKQVVIVSGGLEQESEEKQLVHPTSDQAGLEPYYHGPAIPLVQKGRSSRRRWWFIAGLIFLVVVIAVAVAIGVSVSKHKKSNVAMLPSDKSQSPNASQPINDIPVNATINPSPVTSKTHGNVLKGTRLTMMDPRTQDLYLFYQWDDGGLRYISQSSSTHTWQGSMDLHITDAKLGTALTSVFAGSIDPTIWWLFYVDNANVIQNIYSENDATTWHKGSIGNQGYKVPNATNIAFTVSRGRLYNSTANDLDGGLSLYAGGEDGTIHEYIYSDQDGGWSRGFPFPNTDGYSGASVWGTNSQAFLHAANSDQSLLLWYRDYNNTSTNKNNHWQHGPSSRDSLMHNGSMCGQFGLFYQSPSGYIQGSNFSEFLDASQTQWDTTYNITDQAAMEGSAVSCWFFFSNNNTNPDIMYQIFYQTKENGIQQAIRTWGPDNATVPGTWEYSSLPMETTSS